MIVCDHEEDLRKKIAHNKVIVYFHTPMCGTCGIAEHFLTLTEPLIRGIAPVYKSNISFFPEFAKTFEIKSVPCALFIDQGKEVKKVYAFESVTNMYEHIQTFISK
ncbi:thioredoxin family protein [Alteribacter aurantiacus]|uniref:thioredoxin family protein n=1 Tax=Alteribacter aurantiacus TaxID=254410 RepID=UPI00040A0693|nr:thioredoxin family protein [Alteribacter aurantiacus]